jgi:glycosyltransferase involved in cell wall biosynthesis
MEFGKAKTGEPMFGHLTVVLPARNEARSLETLLPRLRVAVPGARLIVVDDGSEDDTPAVCASNSVETVRHPYQKGNGAAIKSGARAATGEILALMDADGQHDPHDLPKLIQQLGEGYDMVIGAREFSSQASVGRGLANAIYNRLASYMTGYHVPDLTSGFRAVRTDKFREFLYLLPNGFSYPTTITMAFFRAGYSIRYVTVPVAKRIGRSHIRIWRDGARFLMIIFKIGTLYSPLKLFLPISAGFFCLGVSYYAYTFLNFGRFTNMSALLFITSVLVFLIGLVSEQITTLVYRDKE